MESCAGPTHAAAYQTWRVGVDSVVEHVNDLTIGNMWLWLLGQVVAAVSEHQGRASGHQGIRASDSGQVTVGRFWAGFAVLQDS